MEDAIIGLFWGMVFGTPVGWFLRSAAQWRREARRVAPPAAPPQVHAAPVAAPASTEIRVERLLDRLNQRLETLEDRLDFAERLLDSRTGARAETAGPRLTREPTPQR
jgi:hypothetical protein